MGGYTSSRTQHALQRTKTAHSDVDFDSKLAEAVNKTKLFRHQAALVALAA